jgi:hypothetical protein
MSYLEIYNETLFDLLAPGGVNVTEDLVIIDDPKVRCTLQIVLCVRLFEPMKCAWQASHDFVAREEST